MEQIQSHEIKDIYRIREGLLVEVHKYKRLQGYSYSKRKEKRVKGCKGLTVLTEDYAVESSFYGNITYPKGTYFYSSSAVEPLKDKKDFKFEIKSSGGSIYGSEREVREVLKAINEILDKY